MKYLAFLKDSLVETLDRKSLYVILVTSVLLIALCASIGFRELDVTGALEHVVKGFGSVFKVRDSERLHYEFDVTFTVSDVKSKGNEHEFVLRGHPVAAFHRAVRTWNAIEKGLVKREGDPVEGVTGDSVADPGPELEAGYLRAKFRTQMLFPSVLEPKPTEAGGRPFAVKVSTSRLVTLEGAHEVSVLFGAWSTRLPTSMAIFLLIIEVAVADWIAGFFGVMLAVIFTAGFIPGMIQKGTLDLLLAKPVRRPLVILTKYLGGLFYVLIPATVLISGCWIAISWRSGFYNFGFLASIGVLAAMFAVLYSFGVLMGVLTRSTVATILLTVGLWFMSFLIMQTHTLLNRAPELGFTAPAVISKSVEKIRLVLPRTTELSQASNYYILKGNLGPELDMMLDPQRDRGAITKPDWLSLGLSSAGFILAMLSLACWRFSRRDY